MGGAVAPRRSPLLVRIEPLKAGLAALVLFGVLAAAAQARPVAVVVIPPDEPFPANGALGLFVPGAGDSVSRESALAALVRGKTKSRCSAACPAGSR